MGSSPCGAAQRLATRQGWHKCSTSELGLASTTSIEASTFGLCSTICGLGSSKMELRLIKCWLPRVSWWALKLGPRDICAAPPFALQCSALRCVSSLARCASGLRYLHLRAHSQPCLDASASVFVFPPTPPCRLLPVSCAAFSGPMLAWASARPV